MPMLIWRCCWFAVEVEVTKFKHLARRARSSHQAQLRELKNELAGLLEEAESWHLG